MHIKIGDNQKIFKVDKKRTNSSLKEIFSSFASNDPRRNGIDYLVIKEATHNISCVKGESGAKIKNVYYKAGHDYYIGYSNFIYVKDLTEDKIIYEGK